MFIKNLKHLKKAIIKITLFALSAMFFTLLTTSCNQTEYSFPDYATPEYFMENYFESVPNLHCTEGISDNCVKYDIYDYTSWEGYEFYKISGVELSDFVWCKNVTGWMSPSYDYILKHKDTNIDPITDWEIDTISICTNYEVDLEYVSFWVDSINIVKISSDSELYNLILETVSEELDEEDRPSGFANPVIKYSSVQLAEASFPYRPKDATKYCLRITFKQSDYIEWRAQILSVDGKYYLERYTVQTWDYSEYDLKSSHRYYCYLGEEFDVFVSSVLAKH